MPRTHDTDATTQALLAGMVPAFLACPLFTNRKATKMYYCRRCERTCMPGYRYCSHECACADYYDNSDTSFCADFGKWAMWLFFGCVLVLIVRNWGKVPAEFFTMFHAGAFAK